MFSSIRAKFLAILLPLFLVSFIVLSGISYKVSNDALVDDADKIARRTAGEAGEYLDKVMTEKSIRLEELADHPAMRTGDRNAKIADQYDYYNVPCIFCGDRKLYECRPGDDYRTIRQQFKNALDFVVRC